MTHEPNKSRLTLEQTRALVDAHNAENPRFRAECNPAERIHREGHATSAAIDARMDELLREYTTAGLSAKDKAQHPRKLRPETLAAMTAEEKLSYANSGKLPPPVTPRSEELKRLSPQERLQRANLQADQERADRAAKNRAELAQMFAEMRRE